MNIFYVFFLISFATNSNLKMFSLIETVEKENKLDTKNNCI